MTFALRAVTCILIAAALLTSASVARVTPSDGARPAYRDQLWRMSGRLVARDGRAFSFAAAFFRYAQSHGTVLCPASISILDESSGHVFQERRTERAGLGLADVGIGTLSIRVSAWRLREPRANGASHAFDLDARLAGVSLRIHGVARKPSFTLPSSKNVVDEYSSIANTGTVALGGTSVAVTGKSWLDHELSNGTPDGNQPRAQYRVQLDDGREIFVETWGSAGTRSSRRRAYLVERNGSIDELRPDAYEFGANPGVGWRSTHTGIIYPDIWALHVDNKTEFLSLEPVTYDQESLAHNSGLPYWDGGVDVYDVTPGSQGLRLGSGYVLMTGYAPEEKRP